MTFFMSVPELRGVVGIEEGIIPVPLQLGDVLPGGFQTIYAGFVWGDESRSIRKIIEHGDLLS
jgi:hypothetical protein